MPIIDIPPLNLHLPLPFILTVAHHINHPPSTVSPVVVRPQGSVIVQVVLLVLVSVLLVVVGGGGCCIPASHPSSEVRLQGEQEDHVHDEDADHPQHDDHHHLDDGQGPLLVLAQAARAELLSLILSHISEHRKNHMLAVAVRGVDARADVDLPMGEVRGYVWVDSVGLRAPTAAPGVHVVSKVLA